MDQQDNKTDFLYRIPRRQRKRMDYDSGVFMPFEVTAERSNAMHFSIYLFGPIEDASQFIGPIEVMNAAGEGDLVEVNLSTPGGSLDATDTFIQAMRECEGRVVVRATGGVHSAGTIILMNASEFTLSENFNSLIHNGSLGSYDDYNKFVARAQHGTEHMARIMRTTYEGFLTPEELTAMIDGKDFWLDGGEWMRRWNMRQEHFKAKLASQKLLENAEKAPKPHRRRKKQEQSA